MYPIVKVKLLRGREVNQWVIERCPYCFCSHRHGAGSVNEDRPGPLGHRGEHCYSAALERVGKSHDDPDMRGYILEWDGDEITLREVHALGRRDTRRVYGPFMAAGKGTFKGFLRPYLKEQSPLGDLARDVYFDHQFPKHIGRGSHLRLMDYLYAAGSCDRAIEVAEQAWGLYAAAK